MESEPEYIVFFDGVCGFCNLWVDRFIRLDKNHLLRFAPLQGVNSLKLLGRDAIDLHSVVFMAKGVRYEKSEAFFQIISLPGMGLKWMLPFRFFPLRLRDAVYDLIARNRYRWWKKRDTCRVPSKDELRYFLD